MAGFMKRYRAEFDKARKTEDLRKIGERAAERSVTLLFGAMDTEHNNAQGSRPSRELGGAAYAVRELPTLVLGEIVSVKSARLAIGPGETNE